MFKHPHLGLSLFFAPDWGLHINALRENVFYPMRKKVGILTFQWAENLGAALQCYALQRVVWGLGLDVEVIRFSPRELASSYDRILNPLSKKYRWNFKTQIKIVLGNFAYYYKRVIRKIKFRRFCDGYIVFSKGNAESRDQLVEVMRGYTHLISGSDQVWNMSIVGEFYDVYSLGLSLGQVNRISYAASIGETTASQFPLGFIRNIRKYDFVSVREQSSESAIQALVDKPVQVVLDPTLLLSLDEWRPMGRQDCLTEFILVYDIGFNSELKDIVDAVSEALSLPVVSFTKASNYSRGIGSFYYDGPLEFLGLLANARFVVTSSFHGAALSVLYKKKFVAVPQGLRKARLIDLLERLKLTGRIATSMADLAKINLTAEVDYSYANSVLKDEKEKSIDFLRRSLGCA